MIDRVLICITSASYASKATKKNMITFGGKKLHFFSILGHSRFSSQNSKFLLLAIQDFLKILKVD